jgi:hypothetical protein
MRKKSPRFHFEHNGRTFIVYASTRTRALARARTFTGDPLVVVRKSGFYDYATNTIKEPADGPTTLRDCRTVY